MRIAAGYLIASVAPATARSPANAGVSSQRFLGRGSSGVPCGAHPNGVRLALCALRDNLVDVCPRAELMRSNSRVVSWLRIDREIASKPPASRRRIALCSHVRAAAGSAPVGCDSIETRETEHSGSGPAAGPYLRLSPRRAECVPSIPQPPLHSPFQPHLYDCALWQVERIERGIMPGSRINVHQFNRPSATRERVAPSRLRRRTWRARAGRAVVVAVRARTGRGRVRSRACLSTACCGACAQLSRARAGVTFRL